MITLRNDFHNTETRADQTRPLTRRRIAVIRRRLCGITGCKCGNTLGARGPQLTREYYEAFLTRAEVVIAEGRDE